MKQPTNAEAAALVAEAVKIVGTQSRLALMCNLRQPTISLAISKQAVSKNLALTIAKIVKRRVKLGGHKVAAALQAYAAAL